MNSNAWEKLKGEGTKLSKKNLETIVQILVGKQDL